MNKTELIKSISEKSGSTQKDAENFLNAFIESVTESMKKGEDVAIIGFGTFSVAERAARTARNFRTNELIDVPASKTVKFKIGKGLKDSVK
ncbi:MAG: HU family DNA-binding protein [Synergistaceae bacterium]|nr:HU family DNA-binding protein [Synergistaceae bacterium]